MSFSQDAFSKDAFSPDAFAFSKAVEITDSIDLIPPDAKKAIKDFLIDTHEKLWSKLEELVDILPPDELLEYWEIFLEVLKTFLGL